MSIFLLGPQCGPVLGPVLGSPLGGQLNWRWIPGFLGWSAQLRGFAQSSITQLTLSYTAILSGVIWLAILFMLPETLRYRAGNGRVYNNQSWVILPPKLASDPVPESERGPKPPKPTLLGYWKLFSYPPIGIVSVNTALLYSTYFAMAVALPHALEDVYHWSTTEVGAGFLAVGIAIMVGSLVGGRVSDWRRARMVARSPEGQVEPESRLSDQIWGVLMCVAGTIMFGWFVSNSLHVASVLIATFLSESINASCHPTVGSPVLTPRHSSWLRHELGLCRHVCFLGRVRPIASCRRICAGQHVAEPRRSRCCCVVSAIGAQNGDWVVFYGIRPPGPCPGWGSSAK